MVFWCHSTSQLWKVTAFYMQFGSLNLYWIWRKIINNGIFFKIQESEQKSKEEEILQSFHKWKEEEREKFADQIEKVKDMFMKELKELYSRNATLENVSNLIFLTF